MKKGLLISIIVLILVIIIAIFSVKPIKKKIATKRLAEGIALYDSNNFKEAIVSFQKAIKLNNSLLEAYINLAKSQLNLGLNDEAFKNGEKVIALNKNNAEGYSICGEVKIHEENYSGAIAYFDKAIEFDTLNASAYYYRGVAKANLGEYQAALADYNQAQRLDATNSEYLESGLVVRTKLNDYSGIIKDYNKLLELDPSNTEAFYQRGYFKFNIEDYQGAISDFDNALKLDNKLGKAYYYRGLANAKSGNLPEAAKNFNESAMNGYKAHESFFNAGLAYMQLKKSRDAKQALENCIKANNNGPKTTDARINLGAIQLMNSNFEGAINTYTELLKSDSKNTDALFNRAYAYGSIKSYSNAIEDLNSCINYGRGTGDVYYLRAVQLISLGRYKESCPDLEIASKNGIKEAKELYETYCINNQLAK